MLNLRSKKLRKLFGFILAGLNIFLSTLMAQQDPGIIVTYEQNLLRVKNSLMERVYRCDSSETVNYFYPVSWYDRARGVELLAGENKEWFEFPVNNELIRSENGGWKYQTYKIRDLENGGTEIMVNLSGDENMPDVQKYLQLIYYLQIFPNSTIIREKLVLLSGGKAKVNLTLYDNKIRLSFPIYAFRANDSDTLILCEVNLAHWEGEVLEDIDWNLRPNDRLQLGEGKSGRNLAQNHMYHPNISNRLFSAETPVLEITGPISIIVNQIAGTGYITGYEHGSPDDDPAQQYIKIKHVFDGDILHTDVKVIKGAYYNDEPVHKQKPYSTVWTNIGFFTGDTPDRGQEVFWNYLYKYQSEHLAPREPTIYYNTWGLQRDDQKEKGIQPQMVLTEARILDEIEYAHELGVTVFVIDDGWQNYFGDWQPAEDRFPNRFKKIKAKLDNYGMRMGLWMAAEGIDQNSNLYKKHPEWLVRDMDGNEVIGRWNKPVGCFSGDYKSYFTQLCKHYIDQGFTYFKWDGLDKNLCYSADHYHGDQSVTPDQRAERSGYDFILAVTDVAREITTHNPDVVIVYDMTEKLRNVGLAFLSEARFFWINNGATWYDDLSYYRTKSIRTVANEYNQIIPTVLQTSANYPHQSEMYGAQRYNVNTTFIGGGGFWGDLSEMESSERKSVGEIVRQYKRVAPSVVSSRPFVTGKIGASPEIYEFLDTVKSEGQVIAFSGSAMKTTYRTKPLDKRKFFCALRNAYLLEQDGSLLLSFIFPQPDGSNEVFIIADEELSARIESSTCWLKDAWVDGPSSFGFVNGAPGSQVIFWPGMLGQPIIESSNKENTKIQINNAGKDYRILIEEKLPDMDIQVSGQ